jgi:glutaconate CoA-transferase subunit A
MGEKRRKRKMVDLEEAANLIESGSFLALGGYLIHNHAMALVRALIRKGIKDLTILPAAPGGGVDADLLIGAGCVRKLICCYMGGEWLGAIYPNFRRAAQENTLEVEDWDESHVVSALRAAGSDLPFMPTRAGLGSDLIRVNPRLKVFNDPLEGKPLVAVPPLRPDVAIFQVKLADGFGNSVWGGAEFLDNLMWMAAKKVIVCADEITTVEQIQNDPFRVKMPGFAVDAVVHVPYGAHPCALHGKYSFDEEHLKKYHQMGKKAKTFKEYLDRYVYGPQSHEEYLDLVGARTLTGLTREEGVWI